MATDSGIVTIYDTENNGAPLQCHRIDAKEFLSNPRWSVSPKVKKNAVGDAESLDIGEDSGRAMQLKSETNKALVTMCKKAGVENCDGMKKTEMVEALLEIDGLAKD